MTDYKSGLVKEVQEDFARRREERKHLEAKWLLNINFMLGNQYSVLNSQGDVVDYGKRYYWQEREVFNHIAPLIESRLAKFTRVNCAVNVRPSSGEDGDVKVAKLATKLIEATWQDNDFYKLSGQANYWAELTGTAFYKVAWKDDNGGGVTLSVCPPYEVYPDSLSCPDIESNRSIIHAKAYPIKTIEDIWGVKVEGGEVNVMSSDTFEIIGSASMTPYFKAQPKTENDYAIVIERYEAPSTQNPNGRLVVVAGDQLLYEGELPYVNCADGKKGFPFVRQVAFEQPSSFYGMSIIERLIPVQRAYNAVKNRKHEFINRLSCGVLAVEEGSIDTEALEEEGLSPGKVITYRQGANPPMLMSAGSVPSELRDEEDRLLLEFRSISGINDSIGLSNESLNSLSGYAISLLIEQDYSRLSVTTEGIRSAIKEVARQILRLYRQFSKGERIIRICSDNGNIELKSFIASELKGDDVIMESDSTMVETPATRKSMILELLNYGLLGDENGRISNRNRAKIVEMLGFGNWESARSDEDVHIKKANLENAEIANEERVKPDDVDEHQIHVSEHVTALVGGRDTLSDKAKKLFAEHIRRHRVLMSLEREAEALNTTEINLKQ